MQKFHRGDLVKINTLGSLNTSALGRAGHGMLCIVEGSYKDLYPGINTSSEEYSVSWCVPAYPDKGYKCAWYLPRHLTMVASRRIDHLDLLDKIGEY